MTLNISDLKSGLTFGGARSSLFQVFFANPVNGAGDQKVPLLCRAAAIPESTIGVIQVPFMGRKIPEAGDRPPFQNWTVTVINDEDFLIRNAMESWHNKILGMESNVRGFASDAPALYKVDARIVQYDRQGKSIREYTMQDAWPNQISSIRLDWNAVDTIQEFNMSFAFTNWSVSGGSTGSPGV